MIILVAQVIYIFDFSYSQNAKMLSKQFQDRPLSPMETAMYWINYVIEHNGAPHLKSPSIKLRWYQYYLIDVIGIVMILLLSVSLCLYMSIRYFLNKMKNSLREKKDKNQ